MNEQFAKRNENRRKMWRIIFIAIGVITAGALLTELENYIYFRSVMDDMNASTSIIGGHDGSTNIYVSNISFRAGAIIATIIAAVVSVVGIYKTKRR